MEKELLVIVPSKDSGDGIYSILVARTGEGLASHLCSNHSYAYGDLYGHRDERKKEWQERFGEIEVKFIDETDLTEEELLERNKFWATENNIN